MRERAATTTVAIRNDAGLESRRMPALARFIVALAVAVALPVQAMSAVAADLCMANSQHGDAHSNGDDDDSKAGAPHCPPCCASAAITTASPHVSLSAWHEAVTVSPHVPPFADMSDRLDRPPLAS
jgi:hypothetical protein